MNPIIELFLKITECLEHTLPGANKIRRLRVRKLIASGRIPSDLADALVWVDEICMNLNMLDNEGLCPVSDSHIPAKKLAIRGFKHLSVMKNSLAMDTFSRLLEALHLQDDLFLFAPKAIRRRDGSGLIILHASNMNMFHECFALEASKLKSGTCISAK